MKKIFLIIVLFFSLESYSTFKFEFQNATSFPAHLSVQYAGSCPESQFDIESGKIHIIDGEKCGIRSVQGTVYMQGRNAGTGDIKATTYFANGSAFADNGTWAVYGPLYTMEKVKPPAANGATTAAQEKSGLEKSKSEKTVIEAKVASFRIARLID